MYKRNDCYRNDDWRSTEPEQKSTKQKCFDTEKVFLANIFLSMVWIEKSGSPPSLPPTLVLLKYGIDSSYFFIFLRRRELLHSWHTHKAHS